MIYKKQIERLNNKLIDWNVNYSVYPYDACTINELLCQFFDGINSCIDNVNEYTNMVLALNDWIKNEGLKTEVTNEINKLIENGTMDNIINGTLLLDIQNKVDKNMSSIGELNNDMINTNDNVNTVNEKVKENMTEIKSAKDTITKILNTLEKQKFVTVYLNEYSDIANEGTDNEDWSKAFDYVFKNVVNESVAKIVWNGRLKVKSTINLPKHVNLEGTGLPWSGLTPTSDFTGEYVIVDNNTPTHNSIKNLYFDFAFNKNVKGIRCLNPYDYIEYKMLVADGIGTTFIDIGGTNISQTLHMSDCVIYRDARGTEPIINIDNAQELYFANNKFMFKQQCDAPCLVSDGLTNTTFINNSFAFSNGPALQLLCNRYPKRLNGNLITGNLFEGIGNNGAILIKGSAVYEYEGSYNTIENNSYFTSTAKITLANITNTYIVDPVEVIYGSGVRRTYVFNKYDKSSKNPYGNVEEYVDGSYKLCKAWFKVLPVDGSGSYMYMSSPNGTEYTLTINDEGQLEVKRA